MSQLPLLIEALKSALKARGLTYKHVAEALDLSEASVKRLFADENLSIARVESICRLVDLELTDLLRLVSENKTLLTQMEIAQENELVKDSRLLLVFYLLLNDCGFEDIVRDFRLTEAELVALLLKLEKLKLIQLNPNNRVKLRVSRALEWQPNGPIRHFFLERMKAEFLASSFTGHQEDLKFLGAMLTPASIATVQRKIEQFMADFNEIVRLEARLPAVERQSLSVMIAIRPWAFSLFESYRRV